ncbi:MAG: beta-ketoacyl-ACP synthase II [Clostridia bacterium]|nr:beta-ketoacyl-ACP synthase II [Clostridia bacterium]
MNRVVITGMGAVTPVGNNTAEFWNSIKGGVCGIDFITKFDTDDLKVKIAAEVKGFDPLEYFEGKSELRKTDLFVQYAVAAAAQAAKDSGISGTVPQERLGVYVGSGIGGISTFADETIKLHERGPSRVSPHFIPQMIGNMASGVIAIKHKAKGPCLPVVTACATSTHAIGEAFRAIKFGYADACFAGGAEAAITPLAVAGFTNCMALSTKNDPARASIPFDKERDGFVMGEGSGILILEEYEHAKARGAHIYAEVCGYGNTCDAYHVTAPDPEAEGGARALRLALDEAEITSYEKLYINAHGTGTPLNDKSETLVIKKALGVTAAKAAYISSTKSMTGHMLGAAGAAEAIVCALALENGIIPPTIGYKVPDPECDLNYVPGKALEMAAECAVSLSLGFGGHNACIALKKAQ